MNETNKQAILDFVNERPAEFLARINGQRTIRENVEGIGTVTFARNFVSGGVQVYFSGETLRLDMADCRWVFAQQTTLV
jgi:hypothetical protein